jgi:hypothetical protein
MNAADRPEQPRPAVTDATSQKLLADSSQSPSTVHKSTPATGSEAEHQLPNLAIVNGGAKVYDKANGNLITDDRQIAPNTTQIKEVNSMGDQITIVRPTHPSTLTDPKSNETVTTAYPNGSSSKVYYSKNDDGSIGTFVDMHYASGANDTVYLDPKTGKADWVSEHNGNTLVLQNSGKTVEVLKDGPNGGVDVQYDGLTGRPNQMTLENKNGKQIGQYDLDPRTGKISTDPL